MASEETRGRFDASGGAIGWRRFGSGPPLLLINGYAATKDDWDPGFLIALSGFADVICPDNRGVGDSASEPVELTVDSMTVDVANLLDGLGIGGPIDVAGWSMGGFVAQQLAADRPDRVRRLILLGTDPGGEDAIHCPGEVWRELIDHSGTPHEQARRLLGLLFPPAPAASIYEEFGDVVAAAREALEPAALTAQEGAMRNWGNAPNDERLAAIVAPTLVAAGSLDQVIPPENAAAIARLMPQSWLATFPDCGHALMAQEPGRLAALIDAFRK